jgi:hypothetical protein
MHTVISGSPQPFHGLPSILIELCRLKSLFLLKNYIFIDFSIYLSNISFYVGLPFSFFFAGGFIPSGTGVVICILHGTEYCFTLVSCRRDETTCFLFDPVRASSAIHCEFVRFTNPHLLNARLKRRFHHTFYSKSLIR